MAYGGTTPGTLRPSGKINNRTPKNEMRAYKTLLQNKLPNKRGFTPFQFSSRKLQMNTTQLGGLIPDNPISDLANAALSWYEMWINPEKITLERNCGETVYRKPI